MMPVMEQVRIGWLRQIYASSKAWANLARRAEGKTAAEELRWKRLGSAEKVLRVQGRRVRQARTRCRRRPQTICHPNDQDNAQKHCMRATPRNNGLEAREPCATDHSYLRNERRGAAGC